MGAWMVPTPLILRLRSRPSEIPDRQDVFVVAAGRVVDPGGHPERVDDPGMGTPSREPGDFWSVGHREGPLRRGAGAGGDRGRPAGVGVALALCGDCRTPTSTRSSRAHRPTLPTASRSLLLPETPSCRTRRWAQRLYDGRADDLPGADYPVRSERAILRTAHPA